MQPEGGGGGDQGYEHGTCNHADHGHSNEESLNAMIQGTEGRKGKGGGRCKEGKGATQEGRTREEAQEKDMATAKDAGHFFAG